MKIGGSWLSIDRTCIGEVWVRSTTSSGPGGSVGRPLEPGAVERAPAQFGSSVPGST